MEHKLTQTVSGTAPAGFSASWWALWNSNNFYVFVDVNDSKIVTDNASSWQDDSVEIYIDGGNKKLTTAGATDFQYRIAADQTTTICPLIEEYHNGAAALTGVEYAVSRTERGYSIEAKFPWATLLLGGTAVVGDLEGFEVHVNNNDGTGAGRFTQLSWLTTFADCWSNPSHCMTIVLVPGSSEYAAAPAPADAQKDVPRDISILSWESGEFAASHDVYFGTVYDDVNNASRTSPKGVLVGQGQQATTFDLGQLLTFGQTYYWRIDEVNAPEKPGLYRGDVWSFTVEPYAYPVKPAKATASSFSNTLTGPEKTIDSSGLDALDQHSTSASQMWLSKKNVTPIWIQYEFDSPYRLYQMWVWNQNQMTEPDFGFGAKEVSIEVSTDGSTWTAVGGVVEFAQAPGDANYVHNTTIDFGGTLAKYVRLTLANNWADGTKQAGLSEVRFFYIPVKAFEPVPATGTTGVALNTVLNWRPGREAVKHEVSFGTDLNALPKVATVTEHRYALNSAGLEYGRTYYWKVNEVNDAASPSSWAGDVWSLTTVEYAVVDDFESYNDLCYRIFWTWVDQYGYNASTECGGASAGGNGSGSTVGNAQAPYAEQTIVHSGRQSLPVTFDNTRSPYYSEAQREWTSPQVWTGGGANTLRVYLRGDPTAFVETPSGAILMNGTGTDIWDVSDQLRFSYKSLKGNGSIVAKVESVSNTNTWAKAGVMIRETLEASAANAGIFVTPDTANGISFQNRATASATSTNLAKTGLTAPYWVKLTRTGNTFTAHHSVDGITWVEIAVTPAVTITMANDVYIGLAVTSHATDVVCGAKFSNVSSTGGVSGLWQVAEIGVTQVQGNTPETCYVAVQDSAGKLKVVSNPDPAAIATGNWEEWNIPLSQFTSAGVSLNSVKKLLVGVGDRISPKAGSVGKLYIDDIRLTRVSTP